MSRSNIIGLVVIMALLIGYSLFMTPSKEEMQEARKKADSIAKVEQVEAAIQSAQQKIQKTIQDSLSRLPKDTLQSLAVEKFGAFANSTQGKNQFYVIENEVLKLKISAKGGSVFSAELKDFKTHDTLPLVISRGDSSVFGFEFNTEDLKSVNTNDLFFQRVASDANLSDSLFVKGKDSLQFALRLYPSGSDSVSGQSGYIEYLYTLKGNEYMVGFSVRFVGLKGIVAQNTQDLLLTWNTDLYQQEKSFKNELTQSTIYYMDNTGDVNYLTETSDEKERVNTPVKWVSFKDQFFSATLIAPDKFESTDLETISHEESDARLLKTMKASFTLPYNPTGDQAYNMRWFFGPNKYKLMRGYDLSLERQIPLGWSFFLMQWINRFAVLPVFNWLESFDINYGIIILILTVLLKIVLFPVAWKTYISSAKMRILKPEVEEINAKYPKKEDAMKKQQAVMSLYKKAGANPMSGCVPMLLQFPILIALFRFFPASIELRQESFLWAHDLSSYDSVLNLPFTIPFYGDHVSLFCLLMTISTIIYTKMNNDMMGSTNQLPGMKTMMYLMPIMFLGFFNSYSSGLSYYYLLANLFTFAQMYFIRRMVNEDKLHARIQENKKKPVVKSGFQKRLEEMAKKQGYQTKK
ncbi:MAG: membrane protein insertase YidC [Bacteroidales bacterium]|nr:membrane protein insertase YidC [Bacteroidales bacterium]